MRLRAMAAVAGLTLLASTRATAASFEEEFPRRVVEELRRRNPALVDTLTLADSASAQNRYQDAAALYARIRTAEPRFSHAWRREGYELMRSGLRPDAIARMRTAISLEDSCWNQYGLAAALFYTPSTQEPTPAEVDEAESLIRRSEIQRELPEAAQLGCLIAMRTGDKPWLDDQSERFVRLAPSNPVAHAFRAAHLTATGDRSRARSELLRARQLGLDEDTYRHLLDATAETPFHHIVRIGAWTLAIWVAGLVLLLGVGHMLSEATLRTSKRLPSQAGGQATGADAGLRQTYRAVLTACCAYYYISLPIVLASVLLVGGGLVYLLLETGHIPVKLVLIIAVLTLVTLWSVVKSIFLRSHDEDPGLPLEAGTYPRLRKVLDEVASRIETRPVTNVYLTPGTECAVMERGGMGRQIRGQTERCLILGVGMLEGWKTEALPGGAGA